MKIRQTRHTDTKQTNGGSQPHTHEKKKNSFFSSRSLPLGRLLIIHLRNISIRCKCPLTGVFFVVVVVFIPSFIRVSIFGALFTKRPWREQRTVPVKVLFMFADWLTMLIIIINEYISQNSDKYYGPVSNIITTNYSFYKIIWIHWLETKVRTWYSVLNFVPARFLLARWPFYRPSVFYVCFSLVLVDSAFLTGLH